MHGVLEVEGRRRELFDSSTSHILESGHGLVMLVPQDGLDIVSSCLSGDKRGMKRAVLEVVATKAVTSAQDVQRYIKCTLLAATTDFQVASPPPGISA